MSKFEPKKIGPFPVKVANHNTDKPAGKEPIYKVVLESPKISEFPIKVTVKSNSDHVFTQFPNDTELQILFVVPQTQL